MNLGHASLAAQAFNAAAEINDQIVDVYIGLATAQYRAGRSAEAENTLSLAAAIEENTTLLFAETARLQFGEVAGLPANESPAADETEILDRVLAAHRHQAAARPDSATLQYRFGLLLLGRGLVHQAIRAFSAALAANPTYHRARTKLCLSLMQSGEMAKALKYIEAPAALTKETVELHYRTAILFCNRERFAEAVGGLQDWMSSHFVSPGANSNISVVLENMGLVDRAACVLRDLAATTAAAGNGL
jgi:tetratricopeptide (TPR) repeat protein